MLPVLFSAIQVFEGRTPREAVNQAFLSEYPLCKMIGTESVSLYLERMARTAELIRKKELDKASQVPYPRENQGSHIVWLVDQEELQEFAQDYYKKDIPGDVLGVKQGEIRTPIGKKAMDIRAEISRLMGVYAGDDACRRNFLEYCLRTGKNIPKLDILKAYFQKKDRKSAEG